MLLINGHLLCFTLCAGGPIAYPVSLQSLNLSYNKLGKVNADSEEGDEKYANKYCYSPYKKEPRHRYINKDEIVHILYFWLCIVSIIVFSLCFECY